MIPFCYYISYLCIIFIQSTETCKKTSKNYKTNTNTNNNICGFKKGFLSSSKPKADVNEQKKKADVNSTKEKSQESVQFDIKKNSKAHEKSKVFTEVQDAMKQQIPLLQSRGIIY